MSALSALRRHSDARGHLVAVTGGVDVPFEIQRVFWIYGNTDGLDRAHHASRSTTELLVSVSGSCQASVDGPDGVARVTLDRPDRALLMPPLTWLELSEFTPDCVLLVFADAPYDRVMQVTRFTQL